MTLPAAANMFRCNMKIMSGDGSIRIGDLWLDDQNDVSIVTGFDENGQTVTIEVINGKMPDRKFYERYESFGINDDGQKMFFHTLLSRSLND